MLIKRIYIRLFVIPKRHLKYLYYELLFLLNKSQLPKVSVLDDSKTVEEIINNHKSVARFGDGEINWILGNQDNSFQDNDDIMARKLKEVLVSKADDLLVCIPSTFNTLENLDLNSKHFWSKTMHFQRFHILHMLNDCNYGNSLFTRPYMIYKNKNDAKVKFSNIMRIWEKKDIVIVEGEYTFFGVNNDLLDNATSVSRIIAPSTNAFSCYGKILDSIKMQEKSKLILLSLGPTATILAYELSKIGYQAIDIGHVDIEYEWFKLNAKKKVAIPGKYVNEIDKKIVNQDLYKFNDNYVNSIITKIEY